MVLRVSGGFFSPFFFSFFFFKTDRSKSIMFISLGVFTTVTALCIDGISSCKYEDRRILGWDENVVLVDKRRDVIKLYVSLTRR